MLFAQQTFLFSVGARGKVECCLIMNTMPGVIFAMWRHRLCRHLSASWFRNWWLVACFLVVILNATSVKNVSVDSHAVDVLSSPFANTRRRVKYNGGYDNDAWPDIAGGFVESGSLERYSLQMDDIKQRRISGLFISLF